MGLRRFPFDVLVVAGCATAAAWGFASCKTKAPDVNVSKKPALPSTSPITNPGTGGADAGGSVIPSGAAIYDATYSIAVSSGTGGIEFCDGEIHLKLNASFGGTDAKVFDIPNGNVKCLGGLLGEFDLAKEFGALSKGTDNTSIIVKDNLMYLKGFGGQTYAPPYRPFLPSFIAAPRSALTKIMLEYNITATDVATGKTDSGFVGMQTVSSGEVINAPAMGYRFTDTIRFRTINKGFLSLDKINGFLFDKFEMVISFKPLAAPIIILQTKVRDLLKALPASTDKSKAESGAESIQLPGGVLGDIIKLFPVTITLTLTKLDGFKP